MSVVFDGGFIDTRVHKATEGITADRVCEGEVVDFCVHVKGFLESEVRRPHVNALTRQAAKKDLNVDGKSILVGSDPRRKYQSPAWEAHRSYPRRSLHYCTS